MRPQPATGASLPPSEGGGSDAPAPLGRPQRTFLEPSAIVPEALHRKVSWDIRHHFMAEKIVDRFGLVLPRDRELIRQLAVVYVLEGLKAPASAETARNADEEVPSVAFTTPHIVEYQRVNPFLGGGKIGERQPRRAAPAGAKTTHARTQI